MTLSALPIQHKTWLQSPTYGQHNHCKVANSRDWTHDCTYLKKYNHFKNQDQDWIDNPKHTKKLHNAPMIKLSSQSKV